MPCWQVTKTGKDLTGHAILVDLVSINTIHYMGHNNLQDAQEKQSEIEMEFGHDGAVLRFTLVFRVMWG